MRAFYHSALILLVFSCSACVKKAPAIGGASSGVAVASISNEPFNNRGCYVDSFSDLGGAIQIFEDGVQNSLGEQRTRLVFPFGAQSNEPLKLQAVEDERSMGFDGKPGVLAFSWETIPATLAYSGFVYQGRISQSIRLPLLHAAKSAEDLDGLQLRFRYKGVKSNAPEVAFQVRCRVEPNVPDAYNNRLELMTISVSDQWQLFEAILGDGSNSKAFLQYIASDSFDGNFKLSWSQIGAITNYTAATLLIDDIELGSVESDNATK